MHLVLEDGTEFKGVAFGGITAVGGEVVFNTAMTGYPEMLTDPSYRGQILVFTYPLVGNYGVPPPRAPGSLAEPYESDRIQVQGLVVQQYIDAHSHTTAERSLSAWLVSENIPGMTGVDTRTLTRHLRKFGTIRGWLVPDNLSLAEAQEFGDEIDMRGVVDLVSPTEVVRYTGGEPKILLVDIGAKDNIVRSLISRGATVVRANWRSDLVERASDADGIVLSNGPGDPNDFGPLVELVRTLIATYEKPTFGICLGHQILALAAGGDTYKLKYGHRGVNQPVQDLLTRRSFVTSQNHGYAVDDNSLPNGWEPWFVNMNDGTNEGIQSHAKPFFGVQFHPEASPGPHDTGFLFDDFLRLVRTTKRG